MSQFPKNPQRLTPYPNFRFKLKMDGKHVAGISKVAGLTETSQVIKFREGGDPSLHQMNPGQTEFEAITLERGVTNDIVFTQWCNKVWDYTNTESKDITSLKDYRKNIILELYNEAGQLVLSYTIYNSWPSKFIGIPELDGSENATLIQTLVLQNEGWKETS